MAKHRTRAGGGSALHIPGGGNLTGRKKRAVEQISREFAPENERLERALAASDLTPRQREILEQAHADLLAEARRRILAVLQSPD